MFQKIRHKSVGPIVLVKLLANEVGNKVKIV